MVIRCIPVKYAINRFAFNGVWTFWCDQPITNWGDFVPIAMMKNPGSAPFCARRRCDHIVHTSPILWLWNDHRISGSWDHTSLPGTSRSENKTIHYRGRRNGEKPNQDFIIVSNVRWLGLEYLTIPLWWLAFSANRVARLKIVFRLSCSSASSAAALLFPKRRGSRQSVICQPAEDV